MGMTFGEAIENMKKGEKVARRGWNAPFQLHPKMMVDSISRE